MSVQQQGKANDTGRNLVPVKPVASHRQVTDTAVSCKPARSPFLTQLSRQYESREEASIRRREVRSQAKESYSCRPHPGEARHIIWA